MTRGGKREGAGRKPLPEELKRIGKCIRLPAWLWAWLDLQPRRRGKLLEEAAKRFYKLKPPLVKK